MRRDDFVDFHSVADHHIEIHLRLEAWARWVRVRPQGWQTQPMFMQYRSKNWQWETPVIRVEPNLLEVVEIERAVSKLPDKNREAIRWAYVAGGSPIRMARHLAVSKQGLMDLIAAGRTMLTNRL